VPSFVEPPVLLLGLASRRCAENDRPRVVQERVGHAKVAITLKIYGHVSARLDEDAAAKVVGSSLDAP
jgi:integrase